MMASACKANVSYATAQSELAARVVGLQNAMSMRAITLLQLQAHQLVTRLALHNPFLGKEVLDVVLVDAFQMACMSPVAATLLEFSARVVPCVAAAPQPFATLPGAKPLPLQSSLSLAVVQQFVFTDMERMAAWLTPGETTELRRAKVSDLLALQTRRLMDALQWGEDKQKAYREKARIAWVPHRNPNELSAWRCCCAECAAWVRHTRAKWAAFMAVATARFPWTHVWITTETHMRSNAHLLRHVPPAQLHEISQSMDLNKRLCASAEEVTARRVRSGDRVVDDFLEAIEARAVANCSEAKGADADVAAEGEVLG